MFEWPKKKKIGALKRPEIKVENASQIKIKSGEAASPLSA